MLRGLSIMAAVLLTAVLPVTASAADNSVDRAQGQARVAAFLDDIDTLTAHFSISLFDAEMALVQESFGTLNNTRPGRFRWDYVEPYEQLLLSDGKKLWSYDSDLEHVTVKNLSETLATSPAMLLSGKGSIDEGFEVLGVFDDEQILWVTLAPKTQDSDFERFSLGFEGDKLKFMELADRLDQRTRIEFDNVRRNVRLDDEVFRFEPPEGVDVLGDI